MWVSKRDIERLLDQVRVLRVEQIRVAGVLERMERLLEHIYKHFSISASEFLPTRIDPPTDK